MKPKKLSAVLSERVATWAGVLELVKSSRDEIAQPVDGSLDGCGQLARLEHRHHGYDIMRLHGVANLVRVVAAMCQWCGVFWQIGVHVQVEAQIVRRLTRRDVRPHGQACAVDTQVDIGRKVTRAAKTLSRNSPLAPAAL